jgi:methylated-DNA-protein-cysteine methyltransferase related protein
VLRLVRQIPRGRVTTYGQLAALVGRPRSARAVGRVLHQCPGDLPWHRVVNASGGISARPRVASMLTQRILLEQEGIAFRRGRVVLRAHRWARRRTARMRGGCG